MRWANMGQSAADLLGYFIAEFEILGANVPSECYVASGSVPWDGESLTVSFGSIGQGQPGAAFGGTFPAAIPTNMTATMFVQVLREVPIVQDSPSGHVIIPTLAQMTTAGQQGFDDASALATAAIQIHAKYLITDPGEGFVISDVIPIGPDGGLAGVRLSIQVSLT